LKREREKKNAKRVRVRMRKRECGERSPVLTQKKERRFQKRKA
jgi:hypothetical protein